MKNIRIFFHNIIFEQIIISLVCLYSKSSILSSTPKDNFCHAFIHSLVYAESHTGTKTGPMGFLSVPLFWVCIGLVWFGLVYVPFHNSPFILSRDPLYSLLVPGLPKDICVPLCVAHHVLLQYSANKPKPCCAPDILVNVQPCSITVYIWLK